jgi:DNA-binding PadR family transcriptional regulator
MAVLAMLAEEPMHPYRMQALIKQRGKDEVINVGQRASLYKSIERLRDAGLIAVRGTSRDQQWPERTVYELTDVGREALGDWMREALAIPAREFPEFPAALAFLPLLEPADVRARLDERAARLRGQLARLDAEIASAPIPRLFLLEGEYLRAIAAAELAWIEALVADLAAGRLTWSEAWARAFAESAESKGAHLVDRPRED